ncbi:MAG TPA: Na+/H+ antiporter NhaA [Thermodesulfovibrionales bacterium]|nr:Na+/H+ antiporter NhaA [Thermodesulfovibrionales bacterium]
MKNAFLRFLESEVAGSVVLLGCTITAMAWANSPWAGLYQKLIHQKIGVSWEGLVFSLSLQHWVNDALMAVFFFVVGLEIKRQLRIGHLSSLKKTILPVTAAAGGMLIPAVIFLFLNPAGEAARGWGVPVATDIAFALGILSLLGRRVPISLKVFLTALAIADDIGAVLVIAFFYTEKIRWTALAVAGILMFLLHRAVRIRMFRSKTYAILIMGIWVAVFASGIHASIAGILVALIVPVRSRFEPKEFIAFAREKILEIESKEMTRESMLLHEDQLEPIIELHSATTALKPVGISLEHYLHSFQAFLVLPVFALCNAGVTLGSDLTETLTHPVSLGIILGLFLGKQIGVTLFSWAVIKAGFADMPMRVMWSQIYGVSCLAGVGFTMSLFVSDLAFKTASCTDEAKIGILVASLISGIVGYLFLQKALPRNA